MKAFVRLFNGVPMYLIVSDDGNRAAVHEPVTGFTAKAEMVNTCGPQSDAEWTQTLSDDMAMIKKGFFPAISNDIKAKLSGFVGEPGVVSG